MRPPLFTFEPVLEVYDAICATDAVIGGTVRQLGNESVQFRYVFGGTSPSDYVLEHRRCQARDRANPRWNVHNGYRRASLSNSAPPRVALDSIQAANHELMRAPPRVRVCPRYQVSELRDQQVAHTTRRIVVDAPIRTKQKVHSLPVLVDRAIEVTMDRRRVIC